MEEKELLEIIEDGETSTVQFKREFDNQDKIAAEMIALANTKGGMIIFGVEDRTCSIVGLEYENLQNIGNKIATIASDLIKPQIYVTTEVVSINDETEQKKILIVYVDEGGNKPYKDNNGTIWIKQASDKRKLTDNSEILRLFQKSGLAFVDEMIVAETSVKDVNKDKVMDYIKRICKNPDVYEDISYNILYQNLQIIKKDNLTLGGLLFFSKTPQLYRSAFFVKAVAFYGDCIGGLNYRDSRDIVGTVPDLFRESMAFFKANLRHEQRGQNFNSVGILEISEIALEELVQNALIHRDYTRNAPIRMLIFDNRIEIISPGCLPNGLTIENIKLGTAVVRNNLMASYSSKLIKYRGLGSGIIRALNEQPNIEFINDESGNQFIVKIPREQIQ